MKEIFSLNYHIQCKGIPILFLILIALVSSSLYLLPLAYSQELSYTYSRGQFGIADSESSNPEGIALDQQGNVYVADKGNNRFSAFAASAPTSDTAFSSEEVQINGNDTGDQMTIPGLF
jgi:DNA-binding beta-propeller fold protein YncE